MDIFGRTGITSGQWQRGQYGRGLAYDAEIARRKAGGRTVRIAITGVEEIDKKLRQLPAQTVNKLAKQSLRRIGKLVLARTKEIIEQETDGEGAYAESMTLRAWSPSKAQKAVFGDQIGVSVMPSRRDYFPKHEEKYGKLPNPSPKYSATEPFYVPAALEFGWTDEGGTYHEPIAPQRKALYDSKEFAISAFREDMRQVANEAGTAR